MIDWTHEDARNGYVRMMERERVAAEKGAEDARRLARYDEMFSLLKEAANDGWFSNKDLHDRLQTFLAAEGKVAG